MPRQTQRARPFAPALSRLSLALTLALLPLHAARAADTPKPPAPLVYDWNMRQGAFVTALCPDPYGRLWIGTEGKGLWRLTPQATTARRYARYEVGPRSAFPDNDVYALAADRQGRVWAGTGRGLCVWDGRRFANYGPPEGLGGWHVSALAVCPTDGDVWAATEGGLTRYSQADQTWTQYGRPEGLPADAVSCLAFARDGTLYAGTQADGVATASPKDDYKTWRVTRGPDAAPLAGGGDGLPSSLINALLVAEDGAVYAGTPAGLARSADGGLTWQYRRGADWQDKVRRLYHAPDAPAPAVPKATVATFLSQDLTEDWVTCLADDGAGHLVVGHRQMGVEVIGLKSGQRLFPAPGGAAAEPADFVASVLATTDGGLVVGGYGGGLLGLPLPAPDPVTPSAPSLPAAPPRHIGSLPPPAAPPTLSDLNALLAAVSAVPADKGEYAPHVAALADDWRTQGDWLGRYGRYWACLCAFFHPIPDDYLWGAGWQPVDYALTVGPSHKAGDSLRYWLDHRYTSDPRALEMPPTYLHSRVLKGYTTWAVNRRQAQVDDHGETYPLTMEGPSVYATVTVPDGLYALSLYDADPAHGGKAALRDYRLSVREHGGAGLEDVSTFAQQPELARGRITGFYEGVWKRFLVRGPAALTVEINRSYSQNTMLPAVTLDLLDEAPPPYFGTVKGWEAAQAQQRQHWQHLLKQGRGAFRPAASEAEAANRLCDALAGMQAVNSAWWAQNARRDYAPLLRWYAAQARVPSAAPRPALWRRLASCYYGLGMYPEWEQGQRLAGLVPARDVERALRWDTVTASNSGRGFAVVTDHLAAGGRQAAGLPQRP